MSVPRDRVVGMFYGVYMKVERVTGVLGARVTGVDVTQLSDSEFVELRALACEHGVVFLPQQDLSVPQQVEFSHRFGPAAESPFIEPSPDHPEVIKVLKEARDGNAFNFGGAWHSDFSFLSSPPSFTILHALDIPPYGGDTLWSCMAAAYNALSPDMKAQLATLQAVHTARDAYSPKLQFIHSGLSSMNIVCDESANDVSLHPLITTHPETGKKILFFNRAYVRDLIGIDGTEKKELLDWLHLHTTDAKFTVRHKWTTGDLAIWDNRSTQHYALNDYAGFRRELHRTTVAGSTPVQ
jgi:taurine dioxygenase